MNTSWSRAPKGILGMYSQSTGKPAGCDVWRTLRAEAAAAAVETGSESIR